MDYFKEMFDVGSPPEDENDSRPLLASPDLTPRTRRKFDSVRNLLERARAKLSLSRSRSRADSTSSEETRLLSSENVGTEPGSPVHLPR